MVPAREADTIVAGREYPTNAVHEIEDGDEPIAVLSQAIQCAVTMNPGDAYLVELK